MMMAVYPVGTEGCVRSLMARINELYFLICVGYSTLT